MGWKIIKSIKYSKKYIAIDIVETLIERNKTHFKDQNLEFQCLNIAEDKLPDADCIILRQVLQHLSNAEIIAIVKKLSAYKYVILTEHIPMGNFIPNTDIIAGQGIRLKHNSGVDLLKTPFNLKISSKQNFEDIILSNTKGQIRTVLFKIY